MMPKKLNGMAKWVIVALAVGCLIFNSGVTYNHLYHLTKQVDKLTAAVEKMDTSIDKINVKIAQSQ